VLAVEPKQRRRLLLPEQHHFLETFAAQIALALERADLEESAKVGRATTERQEPQTVPVSTNGEEGR
jgi:GAF domain-containing protein